MRHSVTNPGYVALLVAHVVVGVLGYGSLGVSGAYARAARRAPRPFGSASLARFFGPGRHIASKVVLLVPLLGVALVVASGSTTASQSYPWIGLLLWLGSAGVTAHFIWPAETEAQRLFAEAVDADALRRQCTRLETGAAITSLLFLAALVVMIAQP